MCLSITGASVTPFFIFGGKEGGGGGWVRKWVERLNYVSFGRYVIASHIRTWISHTSNVIGVIGQR